MWYNGLKVDKDKTKKQVSITNLTRYAYFTQYFTHNHYRFGAYANAALTPGKIYKIIRFTGGQVSVINDRGSLKTYGSVLFYAIDEDIFDILDTESLRDTQINRLLK